MTKPTLGIIVIITLLLLTGCAAKKIVTVPYHFAYCQEMNADKTCKVWATPCGKLECQ